MRTLFNKIRKYIKFLKSIKPVQRVTEKQEKNIENPKYTIEKSLELNLENFKSIFAKSNDIVIREFEINDGRQTRAFICYIEGLIDKNLIEQHITKPLMTSIHLDRGNESVYPKDVFTIVKNNLLSATDLKENNKFDVVLNGVLSGETALFIDGFDRALTISDIEIKEREVTEPDTEVAVRGPHVGFTENIRINTALLRRIIKNQNLYFESLILGKQTHTEICIAYINGIASKKVIEEVKNRLNQIDTDAILESGYIEQFIEDHPLSLFSTIGNTERPDKVAAKLLEGRVAIFCSGTPCVLTVPYLFVESFQVNEDYFSRPFLSSVTRLFRVSAFFITLTLPALYVSIETFHQEMIPTALVMTMVASREGAPFPAILETIIIITAFELLRESGVRLPRQVGSAISIVGALIIGEAAVRAGFVSAHIVIIGALTGISSFLVLPLIDSIIFFRFFLLIFGSIFGLYGVISGMIIMIGHMCSLKSFGVPYLAPLSPTIWKDLKDSVIRAPLWLMKTRPKAIAVENLRRQRSEVISNNPDNTGGEEN